MSLPIMNLGTKIPQEISGLLKCVGQIADRHNVRAYAVGGLVRDLLLDRKNLDIDIVVEGDAIVLAKEFAKGFGKTPKVHKQFGTAIVKLSALRVDFATARKEVYKKPAAYPKVNPGSVRDDLFRRDFTINAMAISLNRGSFGRLLDFFGGMNDLNGKRIRALHNVSFFDDPSRCLRAIRFEQRYSFKIEKDTKTLMDEAISLGMLDKLNKGRLKKEFILMAGEEEPLRCIKRLCEFLCSKYAD